MSVSLQCGITSQGDWCPAFEGCVMVASAMMKACNHVYDCVFVNELC